MTLRQTRSFCGKVQRLVISNALIVWCWVWEGERAEALLRELYRPINLIEAPILVTNLESAELIKYASNAFLATKISFINEISQLCEIVGGDVHDVAKGTGA